MIVSVLDGKIVHEESVRDAEGGTVFSEAHGIAYSVGAGDIGKSYLIARGEIRCSSRPFLITPAFEVGTYRPDTLKEYFHSFTRRVVDLCVD
jgi:hypothetical protein